MYSQSAGPSAPTLFRRTPFRLRAAQGLRAAMEVLVLALVCLSPWAFGGVEPVFEFLLDAGIALVLALWGVRVLLEWKLTWKKCPVTLCLAGLFLTGLWQLTPLPRQTLERLAPATVRLYDRLLPARAEVFPGGEAREAGQPPAGSTISLYPTATRQEMVRLLAVLLLFAAVRNNIASPAAFRRFSVVALANGALLALFGLVQFFTTPAPHQTVYWSLPAAGQVFGPFLCRNHFPYYVNVCLGLGAGLLLGSRRQGSSRPGVNGRLYPQAAGWWERTRQAGEAGLSNLLNDPWALWVVMALTLMLAGVAFCLSRGGLLSLLGGLFVCLTIQLARSRRSASPRYFLLAAVLGLMLVTWFGLGAVEARLATLWQGNTLHDARLSLWSRLWPLAGEYPVWGSGYGTFVFVEPLTRTSPTQVGLVYDHAHNDYLEVLIEGGLVGLVLALLAVGLVFWLGYRAVSRHGGRSAAGLALGGLFGLTTVALHSFGDFGLHIPAIAVLVAVLAAQLCALGSVGGQSPAVGHARRRSTRPAPTLHAPPEEGEYTLTLGGLAPVLGATAAVVFGLVLYGEGWRADLVHRYRMAAFRAAGTEADGHDRPLEYLEAGTRLAPEYAGLRAELGLAHLARFEGRVHDLETQVQFGEVLQTLAAAAPSGPSGVGQSATLAGMASAASSVLRDQLARREERLSREHLVPALRHLVRARDLCPLLSQPHLRIAAHRDALEEGDERGAYLERAKLLMTPDPELWYLCGVQELLDERIEQAALSWRRSLELSDRHLAQIVQMSASATVAHDLVERVLPDRPELWLAAANQLFPGPRLVEAGRPFLEKARALLEEQPGPGKAEDLHTRAVVHRLLGQAAQARLAYQAALERKPNQVGWRLELAQLLDEEGLSRESHRELLTLLAHQPGHAEAKRLLRTVEQRIAEDR